MSVSSFSLVPTSIAVIKATFIVSHKTRKWHAIGRNVTNALRNLSAMANIYI